MNEARQDRDRLADLMTLGTGGETSMMGGPPPDAGGHLAPAIAGYDIIGRLGEGGMGVVWRAVQTGTGRAVALKVMAAAAIGSDRARLRFEREVELAARLDHPYVARVFDGGVHAGTCYYAMELVDGVPLDRFVADRGTDRRGVLRLFALVCRGVQHAHQRGVIHRDLKPSNVLVTKEGEPKVLDFGLARSAAGDDAAPVGASITAAGEVSGTPAYMSPEQAAGRGGAVDTRTDVYSLGVVLFRVLTGRYPHDMTGSYVDVIRRVVESDPLRLRAVDTRADAELDAIVGKATAREPARRYGTAADLADDVDRYLAGEAVTARPPTLAYVLRKQARRHRAPLAVVGAVLTLLGTGAALAYVRVTAERDAAVAANAEKDRQRAYADQQRGESVRQKGLADKQRAAAEVRLAESLRFQGDALVAAGQTAKARGPYKEAEPLMARHGLPMLPLRAGLWDVNEAAPPPAHHLPRHGSRGVAVLPGDRLAITAGAGGTLKLWDLPTGRVIGSMRGHDGEINALAVSPVGRTAATGGADKSIRIWDLDSGTEVRALRGHAKEVRSVAFSPDGRSLASGSDDRTLRLWDVADGREVRRFDGHQSGLTAALAFGADGRLVLSGSDDATIRVWDVTGAAPARVLRGHTAGVNGLAVGADGASAVSVGADGELKVWDVAAGTVTARWRAGLCYAVALSHDARTAVTGDVGGTLRAWDVTSGEELATLVRWWGNFGTVAISGDGRYVVGGARHAEANVGVWSVPAPPPARSSTGVRLCGTGLVRADLVGDRSGRTATLVTDGATGAELARVPTNPAGRAFALSHDARLLAVSGTGHTFEVWDLIGQSRTRVFAGHTGSVVELAFAADGSRVASAGEDGTVRVWAVGAGTLLNTFAGHEGRPWALTVSDDGKTVLSGATDVTPRLWDITADAERWAFRGHTAPRVTAVAIAPDGRTAMSSSSDRTVRVWDVATGRQRAVLPHEGTVRQLAILPGGTFALSAGDVATQLWDVEAGRLLRTFTRQGPSRAVAISAAGRRAVCASAVLPGVQVLWDEDRIDDGPAAKRAYDDARPKLADQTAGPSDYAAVGAWYARTGMHAWAVEMLDRARAAGAYVSPLLLARSLVLSGSHGRAADEFAKAAERGEAPTVYLALCEAAARRAAMGASQ